MISSHNKQLEFLGFCVKVKPVQIILGHNGLKLLLKLKCSYLKHLSCVFTTYLIIYLIF